MLRKDHPFASFVLAVLFILGAGLPGIQPLMAQSPQLRLLATTEINSSNGQFFADATINGSTVRVLIDTGASRVAVSYEEAERLGLHPKSLDYNVNVITANGPVMAAHAMLDRVEVDNVRVDNVEALVLPAGALDGTLLGMSFLSRLSGFKSEDGVLTLKQ